jgi:hypothetical protein
MPQGKSIKRISTFLALLIVIGLAVVYVFADRQAIFAERVDTENNHYQVVGKYSDMIDGWSVSFCWRKPNSPWIFYYLDHKSSRWTNVNINLQADRAVVLKDTLEIGYLELKNGIFHLPNRDQIQRLPVKIVTDSDPLSDSASIYPGSREWDTLWPAVMNSSVK